MTYGATVISVEVPDRDGKTANVTLHLDTLAEYLKGHPFFGSTVGRYANRIAKGKFTLDGKQYTLATNDHANHLHGGVKGFDKKVWNAEPVKTANAVGVTFTCTSADGEEGYPGAMTAKVTYSLTDQNELKMEYSATTDKPTIVNLTNHAYWNLAGAGSGNVLDQEVTLNADGYLWPDSGTVKIGPVSSTRELQGVALACFRREQVGLVFQQFSLLPTLTALENTMLPLLPYSSRRTLRKRAISLLSEVGLEARIDHYPDQMSGGEQQRVAVARAMIAAPPLLLADEPTGSLDSTTGLQIMKLLNTLCREHGCTLVVVTHDPAIAALADRRVRMTDGHLEDA